jgi:hypothetical protein
MGFRKSISQVYKEVMGLGEEEWELFKTTAEEVGPPELQEFVKKADKKYHEIKERYQEGKIPEYHEKIKAWWNFFKIFTERSLNLIEKKLKEYEKQAQ